MCEWERHFFGSKGHNHSKGSLLLLVTWVPLSSPDVLSVTQMSSASGPECVSVCVVNLAEKETDLGQAVPMSVFEHSVADDMSDVSERRGKREKERLRGRERERVQPDSRTATGQWKLWPGSQSTCINAVTCYMTMHVA